MWEYTNPHCSTDPLGDLLPLPSQLPFSCSLSHTHTHSHAPVDSLAAAAPLRCWPAARATETHRPNNDGGREVGRWGGEGSRARPVESVGTAAHAPRSAAVPPGVAAAAAAHWPPQLAPLSPPPPQTSAHASTRTHVHASSQPPPSIERWIDGCCE